MAARNGELDVASRVLAVGPSCALGAGVTIVWLWLVPPRKFSVGVLAIGAVLIVTPLLLLGLAPRLRSAFRVMSCSCGATLWAWLLLGWILTFPGSKSVGGIFLFGSGAVIGLVCSPSRAQCASVDRESTRSLRWPSSSA